MSRLNVVCIKMKKAQMKIQEMAFMLVAVMIFFGMVALIYFTISLSNLENKVQELRDQEAMELARQLSGTPEFAFTSGDDCSSCIDLDRVFYLSQQPEFKRRFWNLNALWIEIIDPSNPGAPEKECVTQADYPDNCNIIYIVKPPMNAELATKTAFVALAKLDKNLGGGGGAIRYDFGRIHASPEPIE